MIKKDNNSGQLNFLQPMLADQIDKKHPLVQLANEINWKYFETEFEIHYRSDFGRPALPIRLMVSLLILKHVRNLSDESVVLAWSENMYFQYFSGNKMFECKLPCTSVELVYFRKRIGVEGMEKIFKESIRINGNDSNEAEVVVDTTVQEKNITFPTDSKLHFKIIEKCRKIASKHELELKQSYVRVVPKLRYQMRGATHPKHKAKARKAAKKVKTIAGRLVRELERKLNPLETGNLRGDLALFKQVLAQKRSDSNKIYSLHEPEVSCISKGKEHKKYEFGCKVSIFKTKTTGVIVAADSFVGNPYDGNTLAPTIEQYKRLFDRVPKLAMADLGYRGKKSVGETQILTPASNKNPKTNYQKRKQKKQLMRRSAIEPVISHLKQDHRMGRNFLKGVIGDQINLLMAAAAFNMRRFMRVKARALLTNLYCALWSITQRFQFIFNPQPAFQI